MTTWRDCDCRACGHEGELMTFCKDKELRCPKCGSSNVDPETLAVFHKRVARINAQYIRPDHSGGEE